MAYLHLQGSRRSTRAAGCGEKRCEERRDLRLQLTGQGELIDPLVREASLLAERVQKATSTRRRVLRAGSRTGAHGGAGIRQTCRFIPQADSSSEAAPRNAGRRESCVAEGRA